MSAEEPPARRLRLAVAGCRYFTAPVVEVAARYEGLADVVEAPCDTESDRPEAHLEEPDSVLTPHAVERLRRESPDAIVVPPGHRGLEPGLPAHRIVPARLDPACLLGPPPVPPSGPCGLAVRPALASPLLVAALLDRVDRYVFLPFVSGDHLRSQLGVARRAGVTSVVTEPAAVPIVEAASLAARSYLDLSGRCIAAHAIEQALTRAVLGTLRRQSHLEAGFDSPPIAGSVPPAADGVLGQVGTPDVLALRSGRRFVLVPQGAITYVTSLGGVVTAFADVGRFWTNQTLAELERRVDPRRFFRLDQSHLVNVTRIAELIAWTNQRYRLLFGDAAKTELVLSRDVGRRLRAALGW